MSLNKAIEHKHEHRKPYYDSRRWDKSCRCHGKCSYCYSNRMFNTLRHKNDMQEQIKELDLPPEEEFEFDTMTEPDQIDWLDEPQE